MQYDRVAGYSVNELFHHDDQVSAFVDGQLQKASRIQVMKNVHEEISSILSDCSFKSILEVGAGELVALVRIASHFDEQKNIFGVDLSLNRLFHSYQEFVQKNGFQVTIAKSDALHLPFPDNSMI